MSCKKDDSLFQLLKPKNTGIYFANMISENDSLNILTYEYLYNGGGVAIADFNNDGLQDIVLTGNMVSSKIYLNKGDFSFQDITEYSKMDTRNKWSSGIAIVDINNDGWKDIYICATTKKNAEDRENMLFINKGLNKNGIPVFEENAKNYGIADDGYSTHAGFFDYDRDGDLDLYVLTNKLSLRNPNSYRPKVKDNSAENTDRLYRNNGNNTFTNVSSEAGITIEGYGLGLAFSDINKDGWTDIYVSNDFVTNDILYINNKNETFGDSIHSFLKHQSQFSMGNDIADVNNDALPDIITLDMLPESNDRIKTTISNKSYINYINDQRYGYQHQYNRNMLHINNGQFMDKRNISFSEVGLYADMYKTEWSWSPLMVDVDNDGNKDLLITNGFPRDLTDKDFANYRSEVRSYLDEERLLDSLPVVKVANYAFKNDKHLSFKNKTKEWGLQIPSFSNGAAFADLDNDGDLDYVVNNINDPAFVFRNNLVDRKNGENKARYLKVLLQGPKLNKSGIGSKLTLHLSDGTFQYHEHFLNRGYLSSVDEIIHFGIPDHKEAKELLIQWPDGKEQKIGITKTNQSIVVDYINAKNRGKSEFDNELIKTFFTEASREYNLKYVHTEKDKIDFNIQRTIPRKFSQNGPGLAVGDVNGDQLEDVIIGGSADQQILLYLQEENNTFKKIDNAFGDNITSKEPQGLLLFDADNDTDLDLYVVYGSIEDEPGSNTYKDIFFLNNGEGTFTPATDAVPEIRTSGSCVRAADYDQDGDLDLFIGGRVVPGSYPLPAKSYLLENNKGVFTDVTSKICPSLNNAGMVTDAIFTDIDNDQLIDLIVIGEFMNIKIFKNEKGVFKELTNTGLDTQFGWWNSIAPGDFDNDGDMDYIVGNLGLNNPYKVSYKHPMWVYADDFDQNGSIDPVLFCYIKAYMFSEEKKLFPVHFWDELNSQSIKFRNQFNRYEEYSKATLDKLLSEEEKQNALSLYANNMASCYIENRGNGKFIINPLPLLAQLAPIYGISVFDYTFDGNLDIVMVGNDFGNEVFYGNYDAFKGLLLQGDGNGNFKAVSTKESGFYVDGNGKSLARLSFGNGNQLLIAAQNQDTLKVFKATSGAKKEIKISSNDAYALLFLENGKSRKIEFNYGSGYLSQSSRVLSVPKKCTKAVIFDYKGSKREIIF